MAAAFGNLSTGNGCWHQHHIKHAKDVGNAAAICEFMDNSLAVGDSPNADRVSCYKLRNDTSAYVD